MKSTGIVRKVDNLGRIVIPIELRKTLGISVKDPLEIYVDTDKIILKKYLPACIFCGNAEDLIVFDGKNICKDCAKKIEKALVKRAVEGNPSKRSARLTDDDSEASAEAK